MIAMDHGGIIISSLIFSAKLKKQILAWFCFYPMTQEKKKKSSIY